MEKAKLIPTAREIADVAYAIHTAAKKNGDDLESPTDCALAALKALGYHIDLRKKSA